MAALEESRADRGRWFGAVDPPAGRGVLFAGRQFGMTPKLTRRGAWIARGLGALGLVAIITLLMLWLVGGFRAKLRAGRPGPSNTPPEAGEVVEARLATLPRIEAAVGTIQPVHRVEVAARLLARVVELNAVAGQRVSEGDVLVRLDDADLGSRLNQAQAALEQALAERDQARTEEARIRSLFEKNSASSVELDRAVTALKSAEAAAGRAAEAVDEARTVKSFATVASPISGVVVEKRVNVGDMAAPGQVLVTLLDPARMQLVAPVREALSRRLSVGQPIDVRIEALDHPCTGTISEIVPEADPASRSFAVKVTGPCPKGVYAGMFGRLLIPLEPESVLVVPRGAIRTVGQLELAVVRTASGDERRAVRVGRTLGAEVEILAGVSAGERVVVAPVGGN